MRKKSLASLIQSLRVGDGIGAVGVVLHPGSAKKGDVPKAIKRAGKVIKEALAETDKCPLHLEDTAGAGGTLGRSFEELAELIDAAGGGERLGICLDSCHLFASGYDVSTPEVARRGRRRVRPDRRPESGSDSLHVNDSAVALGSNRDRHAIMGEGELGEKGCAVIHVRTPVRQAAVRARDRPRRRQPRPPRTSRSRRSCASEASQHAAQGTSQASRPAPSDSPRR